MKHAVYSGTRNLYEAMTWAVKSLIANSSVDRVHLLIEDAEFPYELPDFVDTTDVSGQTWFPAHGPNMKSEFTYMALVRICYTELFPDVDYIVQLDVDTVCVDDVDALWGIDLDGKWVAMAREHLGAYDPYRHGVYYNCGVAAFNLAQMREDAAQEQLVRLINAEKMWCVEQDALNKLAWPDKIAELPVRYNETFVTGYTDSPAIVHFAGHGNKWLDPDDLHVPRREHLRKYQDMTWDEALALHEARKEAKCES